MTGSAELGIIAALSKLGGDFFGAFAAGAKAADYFTGEGFAAGLANGFMK